MHFPRIFLCIRPCSTIFTSLKTWTVWLSKLPLDMVIRLLHQYNSVHKTGRIKIYPLVNNSRVPQGVVLSPYLFSTYIGNLHAGSLGELFKSGDNFALCRAVSGTFPTSCPSFMIFLFTDLNLDLSKCSDYLFTFLDLLTRLFRLSSTKNRSQG